MAKRLNGWWRLWMALSGVWALLLIVRAVPIWPRYDLYVALDGPPGSAAVSESAQRDTARVVKGRHAFIRSALVGWFVPCGGALGVVFLGLWVRRGFQSKGEA